MSDDILAEEVTTTPESPTMEKLAAAVVTVFGLAMLVGARGIVLRNATGGVDPRWWPTVIAAGIIACGLWMTFNAFRGVAIERTVDESSKQGWIQVGITIGALAVVLVLWHFGVGFLVLGPAYLIAMNWVYGLRRWTTLLLFPAIIGGLLYLVFMVLLKVPL